VSRNALLQKFLVLFSAPYFSKMFCFPRLPLVVSTRRAMHEKLLCFSPKRSLQSGKGAVSKGGSLWLIFFRPFFVQRQRKDIKTAQRGAKLYARPATQLQKN
jgi:hypothetical protein